MNRNLKILRRILTVVTILVAVNQHVWNRFSKLPNKFYIAMIM